MTHAPGGADSLNFGLQEFVVHLALIPPFLIGVHAHHDNRPHAVFCQENRLLGLLYFLCDLGEMISQIIIIGTIMLEVNMWMEMGQCKL